MTRPRCPECDDSPTMHPYEFDGVSGWRCDDCGYDDADPADKPVLDLSDCDGNAFVLIGRMLRTGRRAGMSSADLNAIRDEAMNGDYDHLLRTLMRHFDVVA